MLTDTKKRNSSFLHIHENRRKCNILTSNTAIARGVDLDFALLEKQNRTKQKKCFAELLVYGQL